MSYLQSKSAEEVRHRIEKAEAYLGSILAVREGRLSEAEVEVIGERLEACEDFVTLSDVDWQRVCAIILPEKRSKAFRDYSAQTLSLWGRLCETVCFEEYGSRGRPHPTDELPGSHEKVGVMLLRQEFGLDLTTSGDAVVGEDEAMVAETGSNGALAAKTTEGRPTERFLIALRGEGKTVVGKDVEPEDPHWWRLRIPTGKTLTAEVEVKAAEEEPQTPPVAVKRGRGRPKKVKVEEGGWLPFFDVAEEEAT